MPVLGFVLSSLVPVLNRQVLEVSGRPVTHKANNLLWSSLEAVSSRQKQHFRPPSAFKPMPMVSKKIVRDRFFSRLKLH